MEKPAVLLVLATLILQTYQEPPQLISFGKDGKLGVNFGGYHAAVGLGGLLGNGGAGGLFAEAGTPHGQAASAGLGGAVDSSGRSSGGLYAGATAGGNVKAAAGLAGSAGGDVSVGQLFAGAEAAGNKAASGLGGQTSIEGSSGYSFAASKSAAGSAGIYKDFEAVPQTENEHSNIVSKHKKVNTQVEEESVNYVTLPPPVFRKTVEFHSAPKAVAYDKAYEVKSEAQVPVVEEVYAPVSVVEKHSHRRFKPRHHYKTAWLGGYLGAAGAVPPPPAPPVLYKRVQAPVFQKRIDVGTEGATYGGGGGNVEYTKSVNVGVQRNPTFFADIFNIPIQTLSAVGKFLGNAAGSTNVSVQKSASLHAGGYY